MLINRRTLLAGTGTSLLAGLLPRPLLAESPTVLTAEPTSVRIMGGDSAESRLYGYGGSVPGPVIRARAGERVRVRFDNRLDVDSSVHWHGIRINNAMDGVPFLTQEPVPPGGSFGYDFVAPDPGTYWYHSHARSWEQVERGLYGPLIIDGDAPDIPPGQDHILVLDDWRIDEGGLFHEASMGSLMDWSHAGRLGNWVTVNGGTEPAIALQAGKWQRLRLINCATARILEIDLDPLGAEVVARDGQPVPSGSGQKGGVLLLAPAQRADLLVRFDSAQEVPVNEVSVDTILIAKLVVSAGEDDGKARPVFTGTAIAEPSLDGDVLDYRLRLHGGAMGDMRGMSHMGRELTRNDMREKGLVWAMNGIAGMGEEPLFKARPGQTVRMEIVNDTSWPHGIHLHGHHFRAVARTDGPVENWWQDTILLSPGKAATVAFVADNPGKWMLHCHMLEHAEGGMMNWYEVA